MGQAASILSKFACVDDRVRNVSIRHLLSIANPRCRMTVRRVLVAADEGNCSCAFPDCFPARYLRGTTHSTGCFVIDAIRSKSES